MPFMVFSMIPKVLRVKSNTPEDSDVAQMGIMSDLKDLSLGLVMAGAVAAIGALVLSEVRSDSTVAADGNATANIDNAQSGIGNLTARFGIIATIAGLLVVLGLVTRFGLFGRN